MRWFRALAVVVLSGIPTSSLGDSTSAWQAYLKGDYAAAVGELGALAEAGDADAQYALGTAYSDGLAMPRDYRLAADWYAKAAQQGHAQAQFNLGFLHHQGAGDGDTALPPDPVQAARWLNAAAEAGNPLAAQLLGRIYSHGRGLEPDEEAALRWSLRAADHGLAGGQFDAGVLLGNRRHDARAWIEAYKWLLLAARSGHPAAADNLELVGKRLNVKEIQEAEAAAAAWTPDG